jgi:hypothetical protein
MRERTGFLPALGVIAGTVSDAEYIVRRARDLGLMEAGSQGRHRVWTVDEVAAIAVTWMVHQVSGDMRRAAERRIRSDPDGRGDALVRARRALCFGGDIALEVDQPHLPVAVTVTLRAAAVGELAALVDDWGDLSSDRASPADPERARSEGRAA